MARKSGRLKISLIENWHREKVAGLDEEKYIAELYEDGKQAKRYNSVADMSRKIGIAETTLREIILAYKERVTQQISSPATTRNSVLSHFPK